MVRDWRAWARGRTCMQVGDGTDEPTVGASMSGGQASLVSVVEATDLGRGDDITTIWP
jgi:hypothetical protein